MSRSWSKKAVTNSVSSSNVSKMSSDPVLERIWMLNRLEKVEWWSPMIHLTHWKRRKSLLSRPTTSWVQSWMSRSRIASDSLLKRDSLLHHLELALWECLVADQYSPRKQWLPF